MTDKSLIRSIYITLAKKNKKHPTWSDLMRLGISERKLKKSFNGLRELREEIGEINGVPSPYPDLEAIYKLVRTR